jgi:hypothetical protein
MEEQKKVKIFLDDERIPTMCLSYMYTRIGALNPIYNTEWLIARNYDEFCKLIVENMENISHISFDHDLADEHYSPIMEEEHIEQIEFKEKTGLDCAKWLKQTFEQNDLKLPIMFVHSMNPVGMRNIINAFK